MRDDFRQSLLDTRGVERKTLYLIDGSGYIFRAFYAIRPLSSPSGEPTNASFGFATMIDKVLREEAPTHLAIAFDTGGPNFRTKMYAEYKAHRPPLPEDLRPQIPRIHAIAEAFGMRNFAVPGVEADDVIATLAHMGRDAGFDVCIITGDKDLMQLVDDHIGVWEPMREQHFGAKEVEEKYGVPPRLVADALALAGDASDNVPGVPGVGLKTAAKLLFAHGDLEGVLVAASAGKVKGKVGEKLAASRGEAELSRRLVALDSNVPLGIASIDELAYQGPNRPILRELFVELDFTRLIPKVDAASNNGGPIHSSLAVSSAAFAMDHYTTIASEAALCELAAELSKSDCISVAMELSSSRTVDAEVIGIALATDTGRIAYIPVAPRPGDDAPTPSEERVFRALGSSMASESIAKTSPDAKSVVAMFARYGIEVRRLAFDTTLASHLLEPDEVDHGIESVARRFLSHDVVSRTDLLGRELGKRPLSEASLELATRIVGERADIALRAREPMQAALRAAEVEHVLVDLELPLVPVLARMELAGVRVDLEALSALSARFAAELERLEAECYEAAGKTFNIASPKQLAAILFDELGLKIAKRTKTGPSTDHEALEAIADDHPLPQKVLDYRQIQKLASTYVDALPKMVSQKTGRVHTVFGQSTATTGRLSSNDPNLQNIPVRTELGRLLRRAFVADPGNLLISVDYSQIELRVLAHFSRDPVLVAAFRDGADVHTRTAAALFGVDPQSVTREQRNQAKTVNFGVLYGMGQARLARELGIPWRTAKQFIDDYYARQPGVLAYLERTLETARETGMVRTLFGRRRLFDHINSNNRGERAAAERMAKNTPIQGSAADIVKLAMLRVDATLRDAFPECRLLLQVHDELLLEAPAASAPSVAEAVKREMEKAFPLEVPLVANASVGSNWDEAH